MKEYKGSTKTVDTESSFINNMYKGGFKPTNFVNAQNDKDRRMGEFKFYDPDAVCKDLYKSLYALYHNRDLPNGKQFSLGKEPNKCYFEISDSNNCRVSSDYIGPSTTSAYHAKIADEIVGKTILECRIIGGHTLWPKHKCSINQSRGLSLSDRIDLTLAELKDFYQYPNNDNYLYSKVLRNAFNYDKDWLMQFFKFEEFCDFFFFTGSFVDVQYNIKFLAPVQKESYYRPVDYVSFMKENEKCIKKRTVMIERFLSKIKLFKAN